MAPRLEIERDWLGTWSLKRSADPHAAESSSSALSVSNRAKWENKWLHRGPLLPKHTTGLSQRCSPRAGKCPKAPPDTVQLAAPAGLAWVSFRLRLPSLPCQRARKGPWYFCYSSLTLCPLLRFLSFIFVILYAWRFVKNLLIFASPYLNNCLNRSIIIHCSRAQHPFLNVLHVHLLKILSLQNSKSPSEICTLILGLNLVGLRAVDA